MKGIVKQGVRCRDCGISCHKHCKDHVVVDCNKRKARKSKFVRSCIYFLETELPLLSHSAKKSDSLGETGAESEVYGHGDPLLRERLQRAEEVSGMMMWIAYKPLYYIRLVMHTHWRMQSCKPNWLRLMQRFKSYRLTLP